MSDFVQKYGTDDPRLFHLLKNVSPGESLEGFQVVLLGFPYDVGTTRNGGRGGGHFGPDSVRTLIHKIGTLVNPERNIDLTSLKVGDFGNITKGQTLEEAHAILTETVKTIVGQGAIPFVIGGSNDQSYPNAKGFLEGLESNGTGHPTFTAINIDAHLDVRPLTAAGLAHSGSPFRQLTQDPLFREHRGQLIQFASQGHACSAEHWKYVLDQPGGRILSLSAIRTNEASVSEQFAQVLEESTGEAVFVSFDIDSVSSADCPGVSAPAAYGLSAAEACQIAFVAGKCPKVKLFDLSEYNPEVEMFRTGRLICLIFYHFLMGLQQRN